MRIKFIASGLITMAMLLGSCTTPKNITYFQDVATGTVIEAERQLDIKVVPEDKLSIMVTCEDPKLSSLFNLVTSNNRIGQSSTSSSSGQTSLYTVDPEGNINFPVIGKLHIAGLNRYEVADFIQDKLEKEELVKNPIVVVEFANTGIVVLGAVGKPGRYEFNKDHYTIIDAIAAAGDLNINGEREKILVMRKNGEGKQEGYRVNLLDMAELAQSPVYYLQQDDVIYVQPNDLTKRNTTPLGNSPYTPAFWISLGSTALTLVTLILTLTR